MKGLVFTEFLILVENLFGEDMVDDIIDDCPNLTTKGAYTSVGTYDHTELLSLIAALSARSNIPVRTLVFKYGYHLFSQFHRMIPQFFSDITDSFEFLETVENHIHVEVKKLYPDATLPSFETKRLTNNDLVMIYRSSCPFADFAHGLISGCADFYKEAVDITYEDHNKNGNYCRIFTLHRA